MISQLAALVYLYGLANYQATAAAIATTLLATGATDPILLAVLSNMLTAGIPLATASIQSAAVANGGASGTYALNDLLTVVGGTRTAAAVLRVTGVTAGQVTAVVIQTVGSYSVLPIGPVATTGGGGIVESIATATGVSVPTDTVNAAGRDKRPRYKTQYFDGGSTDGHFAAPVNAATVVCASGYGGCVLAPASSISTLTVQLPSNPYADDDYEVILYNNTIGTITFSMSGGAVYGNTIASPAIYQSWRFKWDKEHYRWIRRNPA